MKILAVGDIVGECGTKKLSQVLPTIIKEENIDFVIVNGENAASGMGITEKLFEEMLRAGADVVTMGNHTWGKKDIFRFIDHPQLLRPGNYPKGVVGKGCHIYEKNGILIGVINLLGRVDINILTENPFLLAQEYIKELKEKGVSIIFIDFHAEATAEKIALGYYLDGKVSGIFGTHTHVPTADETILPKGTGYITDLGMTGPVYSVIGMEVEASIKRFVTALPERYKTVEGNAKLSGCIFEVNTKTGLTENIYRINR